MRIAVATDDGTHIAAHTGRCAGFAIFDEANGDVVSVEVRPNTFTGHARGQCGGESHAEGHSHHSHGSLLDALGDCAVLISHGMGPRLYQDLQAHGIGAVICRETEAQTAARKFARGELTTVEGSPCPGH